MTFAQRRNRLTTLFSERISVVKRRPYEIHYRIGSCKRISYSRGESKPGRPNFTNRVAAVLKLACSVYKSFLRTGFATPSVHAHKYERREMHIYITHARSSSLQDKPNVELQQFPFIQLSLML